MPDSENAAAVAQTALDQLIAEGELDTTWTVAVEFSVPSQGFQATFRQLDPATQVETAQITVDFEPDSPDAAETIKNHVYEWAEMSGGR
jgi:hypothetical protein